MSGQNLIEKIVQKFSVGLDETAKVYSGDFVNIRPAHVMTHDNSGAVISKFKKIGADKIFNPRQVVFALDHDIQNKSEENFRKYKEIESFACDMGIDFYPAGRGIGHQVMGEEGYAFPGSMAVASDSHSNMYGGLGCLGTPVVRTDAAAIWATGQTWWQIPPVAKVILTGKLQPGVSGKDVILALCGFFNKDEVLNFAVEFSGTGVDSLSIEQRLTIANMTTEWGALVGFFPIDATTIEWVTNRAEQIIKRGPSGVPSDRESGQFHPRLNPENIRAMKTENLRADENAFYAHELRMDLSSIQPFVSGPNNVKTMSSATEMEERQIKINKAYLVSCVNSRVDDIAEAAAIVKGKKVAATVEFYISAASNEVQAKSQKLGDWQTLLDAGAIELPPGCGPCIGLGQGTLKDDEVGISATNRNFKGRMGSRSAEAYLASPAVVAASAIAGIIVSPNKINPSKISADIKINESTQDFRTVTILDGFPQSMAGELVFCFQDNLNTDGIYPGKYTYIDDYRPEQQAKVVMENYDPEFGKIVDKGDILVSGFSFGSGSSREQAATALKYRGIQLIIAGSFSQTYIRNAINNGFLTVACPELVNDLKEKFGSDKLTVKTGLQAKIDFGRSDIKLNDKNYLFNPVGAAAQELIIAGGLENWVKAKL